MAVSIWFLYIGVFLCATGVGVVIGAIFIAFWGIKTLEEAKQEDGWSQEVEVDGSKTIQGGPTCHDVRRGNQESWRKISKHCF